MRRYRGNFGATFIALSVGAIALTGCAAARSPVASDSTTAEHSDDAGSEFETRAQHHASELLPAELLNGPYHRVRERVVTGEFSNHYAIESDFGDFDARGDTALRERIREIEALAALREMSKTAEFARAAGNAIKSPFVATWKLVSNPVDTIRGIPVGAWKTIERTSRLVGRERGEFEDSGLLALIGFESKKRQIANELNVDPYSSNPELQKQLNRFAWAAYAGGLPYLFVPFVDDRDFEGERTEPRDRLTERLLYYSPEDLRRLNRIELAVMGVGKPLRDEFVSHPWYSPRHETAIVEALAALDLTADRAEFLRIAVTAGSEDEARFYQHTAELLRVYADRVSAIDSIVIVGGAPMGLTSDGTLLLPLPADYARWNTRIAELTRAMTQPPPSGLTFERAELLVSGALSPLARERIEALGIAVTERAFERLRADSTQSADLPAGGGPE